METTEVNGLSWWQSKVSWNWNVKRSEWEEIGNGD